MKGASSSRRRRRGSAPPCGIVRDGALFFAERRPSAAVYRRSPKAVTLLFTPAIASYLWATVDNQPGPRWRSNPRAAPGWCLPGGPVRVPRTMLPGRRGPRRVAPVRRAGRSTVHRASPPHAPPTEQALRCRGRYHTDRHGGPVWCARRWGDESRVLNGHSADELTEYLASGDGPMTGVLAF